MHDLKNIPPTKCSSIYFSHIPVKRMSHPPSVETVGGVSIKQGQAILVMSSAWLGGAFGTKPISLLPSSRSGKERTFERLDLSPNHRRESGKSLWLNAGSWSLPKILILEGYIMVAQSSKRFSKCLSTVNARCHIDPEMVVILMMPVCLNSCCLQSGEA